MMMMSWITPTWTMTTTITSRKAVAVAVAAAKRAGRVGRRRLVPPLLLNPETLENLEQQQQKETDGRMAVTLADAVFVVSNEKGHGGGRGAAKVWT